MSCQRLATRKIIIADSARHSTATITRIIFDWLSSVSVSSSRAAAPTIPTLSADAVSADAVSADAVSVGITVSATVSADTQWQPWHKSVQPVEQSVATSRCHNGCDVDQWDSNPMKSENDIRRNIVSKHSTTH